ncbi:hypothetical protein JCM8097_002700 [Rhodosporidiobolus ruineniae]
MLDYARLAPPLTAHQHPRHSSRPSSSSSSSGTASRYPRRPSHSSMQAPQQPASPYADLQLPWFDRRESVELSSLAQREFAALTSSNIHAGLVATREEDKNFVASMKNASGGAPVNTCNNSLAFAFSPLRPPYHATMHVEASTALPTLKNTLIGCPSSTHFDLSSPLASA